jgi:hypothetical protein
MALVPRNASCPCGSGRKYKKCCIAREADLMRRAEALEELVALGTLFPLLRPESEEFELWAAAHATADPSTELIERAITLLPDAERGRIGREYAAQFSDAWRSLVADFGDEAGAHEAVVAGTVAAALGEPRRLDGLALELLDEYESLRADPADALAVALDATCLWSIAEASLAEAALARIPDWIDDDAYELRWKETLAHEATRFWTPRHERRLGVLVRRIRAQLPVAAHAVASVVLAEACAAFEHDARFRERLPAILLADSLGPLRETVRFALAAA